jgi:hypothetical protein
MSPSDEGVTDGVVDGGVTGVLRDDGRESPPPRDTGPEDKLPTTADTLASVLSRYLCYARARVEREKK